MLYQDVGDTARARLATVRLMRDTAAFYYPANRVLYAADSAARAAAVRDLEASPPFLTAYTAIVAVIIGLDVSFLDDVLRRARDRAATSADRDFVAQMQYYLAIEQGQPGRAARVALELPNRLADRMFAATFWDGDSTAGAAQYAEAKALVSAPVPGDASARRTWTTTIFDLAQYELARGDTTRASSVAARLRALPPVPNAPVESVRPERLALILDAQLAMLAGRPTRRSDLCPSIRCWRSDQLVITFAWRVISWRVASGSARVTCARRTRRLSDGPLPTTRSTARSTPRIYASRRDWVRRRAIARPRSRRIGDTCVCARTPSPRWRATRDGAIRAREVGAPERGPLTSTRPCHSPILTWARGAPDSLWPHCHPPASAAAAPPASPPPSAPARQRRPARPPALRSGSRRRPATARRAAPRAGCAFPSTTAQTTLAVRSGCTASSGTTIAFARVAVASRASMNMPGRSTRSAVGRPRLHEDRAVRRPARRGR